MLRNGVANKCKASNIAYNIVVTISMRISMAMAAWIGEVIADFNVVLGNKRGDE